MTIDFARYRGVRALITGGLGFIGSNIAHKLVRCGAKVTIIDSLAPLYGGNLANVAEIRDQIVLRTGDFRDASLLGSMVTDADIVFHLAAQVSYLDSPNIPFEDLDINARGTLQLLELCRQSERDVKVIFASSRLALGKIVTHPVREDHRAEPLSLYGVHKLAAENYHRLYARRYGLKTAVLRITNPYGERQQLKHGKYSLPGWFMRLALEGSPIKIFGDGKQLRDYVYATDIADAFLAIGLAPFAAGEVFNCGFGRSVAFRTMAETVVRVLRKGSIEFVPWPDDYEREETGDLHFDTQKIRDLTGWTPSVSLDQGIERMYQYFAPRLSQYV